MGASVRGIQGVIRAAGRRRPQPWHVLLALGVGAMLVGVGLVVGPLWGVWHRGAADTSALQTWNHGGSNLLKGPAPKGAANAAKSGCGSSSPADYALLKFNAPAAYHYAGVAGDGTWDLLHDRSMVHYHGTADPGQLGNVIIAFHREPDYQYIDQLGVGDAVSVQDRACHTYVYKITGHWVLPPAKVTQLVPTAGYDLTLITCDPWWQDYNRMVWRASLVSSSGQFVGGGSGTSAGQGSGADQPAF